VAEDLAVVLVGSVDLSPGNDRAGKAGSEEIPNKFCQLVVVTKRPGRTV
jgi:hypothetical protein